MVNPYYYFAYFIYKCAVKFKEKVNLGPKLKSRDFYVNSYGVLSGVLGCNIMSILFLVPAMDSLNQDSPDAFALAVLVLVVGLNYYFLLKGDNYDKIIAEYDKKFVNVKRNRLHMLFVTFYSMASVAAVMYICSLH
jgi:hypothetical protein